VRTLCDLQGREAGLGRCLGQGGEGAVYSVPMWPSSVAKIYARTPDDRTGRKLGAMVQLGTKDLLAFTAWPENVLVDPRSGNVVGFLMPRIDRHREIHALYGPTDRKSAFPDASWSFLVRAARNLAAAFDAVHRAGHVIGDVNQGNVVVSRKATVRLIDCDSFQITHLGSIYPCRVGVPLFTPPELHRQRLESVVRTADHDRFGLAVLIFQLLFMGRHPFAGRHPERALTVETAIQEGVFAFGAESALKGWEPPPFSLRLRDVSPPLAHLFERAFGREAANGGPRPVAMEWLGSLDELESRLVTCGDDPRHQHAPANGSCPWCRLENEGGPSFFHLPPGAAPDAFDVAATWRSIEAVRSPGPAALPEPPPVKGPVTQKVPFFRQVLHGLGFLGTRSDELHAKRIASCEANLRTLEMQWESMCGESRFETRRMELAAAKTGLDESAALEEREAEELTARFRDKRLPPYLATFVLEFSRLPGLGPAEIARLASRGVVTAADISPAQLMTIHGIDLGLVRSLLLFKACATRSLRFDPVTGIPGKDRKALADRQARRREELSKALQAGPLELAELRRQTLAWRDVLGRALEENRRRLAQLGADGSSAKGA
jgi:DNA-binding helix-hairpin-helix protein with protein kinase domain